MHQLLPILGQVFRQGAHDYHTYFIGAEDLHFSIWAHNSKKCSQNSRELSKNLEAAGQPKSAGQAAHVVPAGDWSKTNRSPAVKQAITDAQSAIKSADVGINSAANGFRAPPGHNGTHTDAYLLDLGRKLTSAVDAGNVPDVLAAIRQEAIALVFRK